MSSIEIIDLENLSKNCTVPNDYPVEDTGMAVGIIDGLIKSCGSKGKVDNADCYDYCPETNSWKISESLLSARNTPRSSFIDGVWLVSGDRYGVHGVSLTTEMWTDKGFEQGPFLPIEMFKHCQLTINSTHIFFADTFYTGNAYLLDWYAQSWIDLPQMTIDRNDASCGLINNPENGLEAVIVEDGLTEIFNFNNLTWRMGPPSPNFDEAGFAQLVDTFVVVGGENDAGEAVDTIYLFDNNNYSWILNSQRLEVAREGYPAVVAVPDYFVTCS